MLLLGIVAASLIFLSAYGGMVSLAQVAVYGIAGFVVGNVDDEREHEGAQPRLEPVARRRSLGDRHRDGGRRSLFGALASRSVGIYFLMITLTFGVIANLFFGQVTTFSGFGGISGIPAPSLIGTVDAHPNRLYYVALGVVAASSTPLLRYVVRTPFGLALQGVRDDPVRMSSLGYNVALHRTLAFGFAGFIAVDRRRPVRLVERAHRPGLDRPRRDDRRARDRRHRRALPRSRAPGSARFVFVDPQQLLADGSASSARASTR